MSEFSMATGGDIPQLAAMELRYIECPWSPAVLKETLRDELSHLYVLRDSDTIVGYGGFKMALDTAEIYNIVVHEAYRRKGYGKQIVAYLIDRAVELGAREIFLEVGEKNQAAIALYTECGFEIVSLRKNYYKSGGALVMKRLV